MNIIRTKVVELNIIPAIAYKIKLSSGGSGVKLHRTDKEETAFAETDKRTGGVIMDAKINSENFPEAAFDEALELLAGLPYSSRGKVKITISDEREDDFFAQGINSENDIPTAAQIVESDEFKAIMERYADETGKINYPLMNKQFIQFAASSKTISDLCEKKASVEDMLSFIVKNRAAYLAGKKESLSDTEIKALIDTIDDIDPRSAFKELTLYLRKRLAR